MTRRSARLSAVRREPHENREKLRSFVTRFSLPSFTKRVQNLTDEQREAVRSVGFENLLDMPNQKLSKTLLVRLMERWSCEKCVFVLPPGELGITPMDVALILGLRVVGRPVVLPDDETVSELEKDYGVTPGNRKITIASLEARLDSIGTNAKEDFVRTFLLFCFGTFLFPDNSGKVNSRYLFLLENLDDIRQFAWGTAILDDILTWLMKRKYENIHSIGGCLIFLQIWAYEHIDIHRPKELDSYSPFPRACKWENNMPCQKQGIISEKFKELQTQQITWKLQPTSSELQIDIIKELLEEEVTRIAAPRPKNSADDCSITGEVHQTLIWVKNSLVVNKESETLQSSALNWLSIMKFELTFTMLESKENVKFELQYKNSSLDSVDRLKKRCLSFEGINVKSKRNVDELTSEVTWRSQFALEENNMQSKKRRVSLEEENAQLKRDIIALEEENMQLKRRVEDLERQKHHQSNCASHLMDQLEKLMDQVNF